MEKILFLKQDLGCQPKSSYRGSVERDTLTSVLPVPQFDIHGGAGVDILLAGDPECGAWASEGPLRCRGIQGLGTKSLRSRKSTFI